MKQIDGYELSDEEVETILDFVNDDALHFVVDEIKKLVRTYPFSQVDGDLARQVIQDKLEG